MFFLALTRPLDASSPAGCDAGESINAEETILAIGDNRTYDFGTRPPPGLRQRLRPLAPANARQADADPSAAGATGTASSSSDNGGNDEDVSPGLTTSGGLGSRERLVLRPLPRPQVPAAAVTAATEEVDAQAAAHPAEGSADPEPEMAPVTGAAVEEPDDSPEETGDDTTAAASAQAESDVQPEPGAVVPTVASPQVSETAPPTAVTPAGGQEIPPPKVDDEVASDEVDNGAGLALIAEGDPARKVVLAEGAPDVTEPETAEGAAPTKLAEVPGASADEGEDEQRYLDCVAEMRDLDRLQEAYMNYVEERTRKRPDQYRPPAAGGGDVLRSHATGPQLPDYRTLDTLLSGRIPVRPLLCGTILERGVVSGLIAAPGSGKTTLVGHLVVALANGRDWAGQRIPGPMRVVYANLEENLDERRRRFAGIAKHMRVGDQDVLRRVLMWSGGRMRLMEKRDGSAAPTPAFENLRAAVLAHRADVLVIDPAALVHGLEENSNLDMTDFVEALKDLARDYDCAVLLAHHTRKEAADKAVMDSARGASALSASLRVMLMLTTPPAPSPKAGQPIPEGRPARVELHVVKSNNAKKRDRLAVFEWASVMLDNAADGEDADEVGVLIPVG